MVAMPTIGQVLGRRNDLSTFVVHLTKETPGAETEKSTALENLSSMLRDGWIEARTPMGWGLRKMLTPREAYDSQAVVCFTETPLEQIHGLLDIENRQVDLQPYGLAFTKMVARGKGANPVWYVDTTDRHPALLRNALDELLERALGAEGPFVNHPASRLLPYFEEMGVSRAGARKEFWWEREWRHVGHFSFSPSDIALVVAPSQHHDVLRQIANRPCIDPEWSLERMIASLAGLGAADVTPFG
jgi:hypothetical protein